MKKPGVRACPVPEGSLVARAFDRVDYGDAFEVDLPEGAPADAAAFTRKMFGGRPAWVDQLMGARDFTVGLFGLKTWPAGGSMPEDLVVGARLGPFEVFERKENELLMGADDRHLDFRISTLYRQTPRGKVAVFSTVVRFRNWAGRLYFAPVKPFHRVIVRALLRGAVGS